ncbi:MAG: hypothetical protein WDO70_01995 [Alphaproteobacteria bacterium]
MDFCPLRPPSPPDLGKIPYSDLEIVGVNGCVNECGVTRPTYASKELLVIPKKREDDGVIANPDSTEPRRFLDSHIERGMWPLESPQPATQTVGYIDAEFGAQFRDLTGRDCPVWQGPTARLAREVDPQHTVTLLLGSQADITGYMKRMIYPLMMASIHAARADDFARADKAAGLAFVSIAYGDRTMHFQATSLFFAVRLEMGKVKPDELAQKFRDFIQCEHRNVSCETWLGRLDRYRNLWSGPTRPGGSVGNSPTVISQP